AEWLAAALAGGMTVPSAAAMAADVAAQRLWRRRTMPPHKLRGSSVMLYQQSYHDQLLRDMGRRTHRKRASWRHPLAECFMPYTAADYADIFQPDSAAVAAAAAASAVPLVNPAEAEVEIELEVEVAAVAAAVAAASTATASCCSPSQESMARRPSCGTARTGSYGTQYVGGPSSGGVGGGGGGWRWSSGGPPGWYGGSTGGEMPPGMAGSPPRGADGAVVQCAGGPGGPAATRALGLGPAAVASAPAGLASSAAVLLAPAAAAAAAPRGAQQPRAGRHCYNQTARVPLPVRHPGSGPGPGGPQSPTKLD
ncbi:hypothetical protein TSOC_014247, partial [Tetrabaena socialis]